MSSSSSTILPGMHPETARRGALVFAAGMALAAVSFILETTIIKLVKNR